MPPAENVPVQVMQPEYVAQPPQLSPYGGGPQVIQVPSAVQMYSNAGGYPMGVPQVMVVPQMPVAPAAIPTMMTTTSTI